MGKSVLAQYKKLFRSLIEVSGSRACLFLHDWTFLNSMYPIVTKCRGDVAERYTLLPEIWALMITMSFFILVRLAHYLYGFTRVLEFYYKKGYLVSGWRLQECDRANAEYVQLGEQGCELRGEKGLSP